MARYQLWRKPRVDLAAFYLLVFTVQLSKIISLFFLQYYSETYYVSPPGNRVAITWV